MQRELVLIFKDDRGAVRRVVVPGERFTIGRAAENDLPISNNALSRQHLEIQRFADVFVATDLNSSNGSAINGAALDLPIALKNGDRLTLGGAVEIKIEIVGSETENSQAEGGFSPSGQNFYSASNEQKSEPIWKNVFLIAPLAGCAVLLFVVVLLLAFGGGRKTETNNRIDNSVVERRENVSQNADNSDEIAISNRRVSNENVNRTISNSAETANSAAINQTSETDKTEKYAFQFLRAASSDQQSYLDSKQLDLVRAKIKSYRNSAALKANLQTARKNFAQIKTAAEKQNLPPEFLAAAALAKLDETSGDAAQTAAAMAEDLGKLGGNLGIDSANGCLIVVAAYAEGDSASEMGNKLQNLSRKTGVSAETARTVWFLKENGKIGEPAFDFVLKFLAIGTVAQNPAEFGVTAAPLK